MNRACSLGIPAAALLLVALQLPLHAAECENPRKIRFALIPEESSQKSIASLEPLIEKLNAVLGVPVEAYVPASYAAVIEAIVSGAVHIARLGPASYVSARRADPQVTAFATHAHKADEYNPAGASYRSVLIIRRDSSIHSVAGLKNKRVALVDPESTSGTLIPTRIFAKEVGIPLDRFFGSVGFTGRHDHSIRSVLNGQVEAAFVSSTKLATALPSTQDRQQIRILWQSQDVPRDPYVYRGQLCSAYKEKIREVFLGQHGTRIAKALDNLDALRFVPVDDESYRVVREIYE